MEVIPAATVDVASASASSKASRSARGSLVVVADGVAMCEVVEQTVTVRITVSSAASFRSRVTCSISFLYMRPVRANLLYSFFHSRAPYRAAMSVSLTLPGGRKVSVNTGLFIDNKFVPSVSGNTLE
jgi:hypothetical protein